MDSGDDVGRNDRDPFEDEDEERDYDDKPEQVVTYDANLQRMHDPEVTDNEVRGQSMFAIMALTRTALSRQHAPISRHRDGKF